MVNTDRYNPHKQKLLAFSISKSVKSPQIIEFENCCPNHITSGLVWKLNSIQGCTKGSFQYSGLNHIPRFDLIYLQISELTWDQIDLQMQNNLSVINCSVVVEQKAIYSNPMQENCVLKKKEQNYHLVFCFMDAFALGMTVQ